MNNNRLRTMHFDVDVVGAVPGDLDRQWDDLHDVIRTALHHIVLDNLEYHFPDADVQVSAGVARRG